jgi:D-alanyl-D-alanine dipeptidase
VSRFDQAHLTTPASEFCDGVAVEIPPQAPLPELVEPSSFPAVTDPSTEPLVAIEHPRIAVVPAYREAGWVHARPEMMARSGVVARLGRAADALPDRFGLCVLDAWRPLELQRELFDHAYDATDLPPGFLAEPSTDPSTPPPHVSGGSIDCTLTIDGVRLGLGTSFDDFRPRAAAAALEADPGPERELRRLLYWHLRAEGFVVLTHEWWHFEVGTRRWAAITGGSPRYGATGPV